MDAEKGTDLFETEDPNKRTITLSENRYFGHILTSDGNHQAHPEITPAEIKDAVEDPEVIYKSTLPDSEVYFSRTSSLYPKMYVKVAVATYEGGTVGDVMTAHLSKHISGNIDEGGLLYVRSKPRV